MADFASNDTRAAAVARYAGFIPPYSDPGSTAFAMNLPYFKMRGMHATINGVYDTWVVTGTPDFEALRYTGALATPLRGVCVIDRWQ